MKTNDSKVIVWLGGGMRCIEPFWYIATFSVETRYKTQT